MSPTHADELAYCCVRALDFEAEDLLHKLREAHVHSFIDEARAAGGKVLVHCFVSPRDSSHCCELALCKKNHDWSKSLHTS